MKKVAAVMAALMILTMIPVSSAHADEKQNAPAQTEHGADTVSAIGSVSKIFCTTAALQLYERGLLDIDAPLTDYIPEFTMQDERYKDITVRMLMDHTSGLMGMVNDDMMLYDDVDMSYHDRFLDNLKNSRLKADPGTIATYCNDGFTLLEIVVERVSGESFTDYVQENISAPLGLENTGTAEKMYGSDKTAQIYYSGMPFTTDYCMASGSGGIMSTAQELCRFGTAFFTGDETLLSQRSKNEMQKNNARDRYEDAFGLGWDSVDLSREMDMSKDVKIVMKGGSCFHQYAGLMIAPDEQISVSVTMNGGSSEDMILLTESLMMSALAEKGIEVSVDEPKKMETVDTVPEKYLKYADLYARADGLFKVSFPDGRYMEVTELTSVNQTSRQYMYTADDCFVLVENSSGKAVQTDDQEILTFSERDGRTYICKDENVSIDGSWRGKSSSYYLQRAGEADVSDSILQAWEQRDGKKYYIKNLKYSNCYYNIMPCFRVSIPGGADGYGFIRGINKLVRIDSKTTAGGFVQIPGSAGRELLDFEFFSENGCEYLRTGDKSLVLESEDSIPELTEDIHEITLENGRAKWYNIGKMGQRSVILDIPEKASVYVYDKFDQPVYSSYIKGYGNSVTLPEEGKIVFIGESGGKVGIA